MAIAIADQANPYMAIMVRGKVVSIVKGKEAEDHIDKMAKKYIGQDKYPYSTAWRRQNSSKGRAHESNAKQIKIVIPPRGGTLTFLRFARSDGQTRSTFLHEGRIVEPRCQSNHLSVS